MANDSELLRQWSESHSQMAMAEFVQRHLGLVYFAALRRTGGNEALAKDIAQEVFIAAAHKAESLAAHSMITGWLFTATRNAASKALRAEQIRLRYEQQAALHEITATEPEKDWERLRPVIDEALESLAPGEREAILARFFEGQAFADIRTSFNVSSDAARMRVDRALDKLRLALERRGISSMSAALATVLATQGALAVPSSVVAGVQGALAATGTVTAAAGFFGFMTATKTTVIAAGAVVVLTGGIAIFEYKRAENGETQLAAVRADQSALTARLAIAEKLAVQAQSRAAEAEKDNGALLGALDAVRKAAPLMPSPAATKARKLTGNDVSSRSLNRLFPDGVVLTVGQMVITVSDVHREIAPLLPKLQQENPNPDDLGLRVDQLHREIISDLMQREVLVREFHHPAQGSRQVAGADVDAEIAVRLNEQFGNDTAKLAAWLELQDLTPEQFRKEVEEDIIYGYMRAQYRKLQKAGKDAKAK